MAGRNRAAATHALDLIPNPSNLHLLQGPNYFGGGWNTHIRRKETPRVPDQSPMLRTQKLSRYTKTTVCVSMYIYMCVCVTILIYLMGLKRPCVRIS